MTKRYQYGRSETMWRASAARVAAAVAVLASTASAQEPLRTTAPRAILIDVASGQAILAKNADQATAPASLAKLMTAAVLLREPMVAASTGHRWRSLFLGSFGDHRLGGDQETRDRGRILQGCADGFFWIDDAGLGHVDILLGLRIEAGPNSHNDRIHPKATG